MLKLRYIVEFVFVYLLFLFFRLFNIKVASNIGGFIGRNFGILIGFLTKDNNKSLRHLEYVFPQMSKKEKYKIIKGMYENIGRFVAEYINQDKMDQEYFKQNVTVIGGDKFLKYIDEGHFPFTAHFGNWEVMQRFLYVNGRDMKVIYKPIYNPHIDKLYLSRRDITQIPKGNNATKQLIELIKLKKSVGVLIDQREKQGEILKFFGMDARTSTVIQRLSLRYNFKLIPVKCFRTKQNPNKFVIEVFDPLSIHTTGNIEEDIKKLTEESLIMLESWIRENPEMWMLWSYSRWRLNL